MSQKQRGLKSSVLPSRFARTPLSIVCQLSLLVQGLGWIPGLAIWSGSSVQAQEEIPSQDMEAPTPPALGNQSSSPLPETAPEVTFEVNPQDAATAPPEFYPPSIPDSSVPTPAEADAAAEWQPATPEPAAWGTSGLLDGGSASLTDQGTGGPEPTSLPVSQSPSLPVSQSPSLPVSQSPPLPVSGSPSAAAAEWSDPAATGGDSAGYDYSNYYIDPTEYAIDVPPSSPPSVTATATPAPTPATTTPPTAATAPELQVPPVGQQQPLPSPARTAVATQTETGFLDQNLPPDKGYPVSETGFLPPVRAYAPAPNPETGSRYEAAAAPQRWVAAEPTVKLGSVQVSSSQVKFDMNKHAGILDYRRAARQRAAMGQGNTRMIFPLAVPTAITSAFGWRLNPISGQQQLHQGVDFGAPLGTPILAAFAGKVAIADWLGGYGLAVVLSHDEGTKETLYGHMSEVLVKEGEEVVPGEPIGLVGSTGFSTGPHLHFEVRELTPDGWVAMDPGTQIEYALTELVKSLQVAEAQPTGETGRRGAGEQGSKGAGEQGSRGAGEL